jgi:hypothetical protein
VSAYVYRTALAFLCLFCLFLTCFCGWIFPFPLSLSLSSLIIPHQQKPKTHTHIYIYSHEACPDCREIPELPTSSNNFTHYRARMHSVSLNAGKNSGSDNNIYYSFDQGLTHFIVFSAEAYMYSVNADFIANQLKFMKADLAAVDRTKTPWVVALVHKDWTMQTNAYADFSPILEDLGVDVLFCGHVHHYDRYYPYNAVTGDTDTACASADKKTYTNPKYMITIVTGASGDHELESNCTSADQNAPSVTCTENYGYGTFQALNSTAAVWNFKTVKPFDKNPDYSDSLLIVQQNHGPRKQRRV